MTQHINLLAMPAVWSTKPTTLSNGLRLNIYVDPSNRYFSLAPVNTVEKIEEWLGLQTDAPARPLSVKEAMRLRDAAWSSARGDKTHNTEEWFVCV